MVITRLQRLGIILLALALPAAGRAIPLNQDAEMNKVTVIIPKEIRDVPDHSAKASNLKQGRFMRLNRDLVTVSYAFSARRAQPTEASAGQAPAEQADTRQAAPAALRSPTSQKANADILMLYEDGDISASHPFNR
jgi:hypothetical protein